MEGADHHGRVILKCSVVLAWLGAQWRDGYGAAVNDHESGRPFIVAPGGRPIVETVSDDAAQ